MKSDPKKTDSRIFISLFTCVLAMAALSLAGCRTAGFKKGDAAADSMRESSAAVQAESRAMGATIESLNHLVNTPEGDLRQQYKVFGNSLDRLIARCDDADNALQKIRERRDNYLQAWNDELSTMTFQVVRDNSEARRLSVSNQLDTICRRYDDTQAVVHPLITYFQDIRKTLDTDLTLDGLASVKNLVAKTGDNTRKVQSALTQLTDELADSGNRLSSTATAAANSNDEMNSSAPSLQSRNDDSREQTATR
jgi:septal ring factor EnvC (AmiA/AmiB activator)